MAFSSQTRHDRTGLSYTSALPPQLDSQAGACSHFFQPPRTPGTSYNYPDRYEDSVYRSRKRARPDATPLQQLQTPYSAPSTSWSLAEDSIVRSSAASPAPLVETRYKLAGGEGARNLAAVGASYDGASECGEDQFRRMWEGGVGASEGTVLGKRRVSETGGHSSNNNRWSKVVLSFAVGAVGKVWDFCWSGAFKGFQAGGGQTYEVKGPEEQDMLSTSSVWVEEKNNFRTFTNESTFIPGHYPSENDYVTNTNFGNNADTPPRAAKRIHTDSGSGWVMVVSAHETVDSRTSSPRLSSRRIPTVSAISRSQIPRAGSSPRPAASKAHISRRSLLPLSRRTSQVSHAGSPALQGRPSASFASPRSPGAPATPVELPSAEAKKFAARVARDEAEADKSIRRLNAQLKAMIKEGKEALGTKVEVVDELEGGQRMEVDEGYFERSSGDYGKW